MSGFPYSGTAVVTGAGSGIGRALAEGLARRGMDLALVDISEDRLAEAARALSSNSCRVTTHALDVADRAAARDLPASVSRDHDVVSLLFNNAGVALGGRFEDVSEEDFDWLMEINFGAVVRLTRAFLPVLKQAELGRIVNVSSIFGIIAPEGQAAYCSSKFAVRGFSEVLRHELEGTPLGVTVVHPGGIATRIAEDARVNVAMASDEIARRKEQARRNLVMPPPRAAEIILRAVERGKGRVLVGNDARMAEAIQRLMPERYLGVLKRRMEGA